MSQPVIYWFRQDLRLNDLPALIAAVASGRPVLACYILDEESPGLWQPGAASLAWLHHSLRALSLDIKALGGHLHLARGHPDKILRDLATQTGASAVYCSRQYEPWARTLEDRLTSSLGEISVELRSYAGSLLWEPNTIKTQAGGAFKVFTPFWRKCKAMPAPLAPLEISGPISWYQYNTHLAESDAWNLLPADFGWIHPWSKQWQPGEKGATQALATFLREGIVQYSEGRDHPARNATSLLSPHLHFGEISPRTVYHCAAPKIASTPASETEAAKFLSELGWREFSHHLLFHFPDIPERDFKSAFEKFPWIGSPQSLTSWQRGETGYPLVDAGMRELLQTGYMHNRVRMVAASFLCKHLLIDWRAGERWFWDRLVDADLANNACGWQWVAGSGADASPYFRIFNPTAQAQKFDKEGVYIRRWVPELSALSDRYLHQPWTAPTEVLKRCGIALGKNYPLPIVDHRQARESALAAYADTKST